MMNPIIQRELVGLLRTRRAFAAMVILVAVLAALIGLRWPDTGRVNLSGEQAQAVLRLFGYGLLVALILLTPIFPASAVVKEKQQHTLALLLNSPLSPWSIFFGKLIASMGFVLVLILLSLPAAAACYVMGGVDFSQVLRVYWILLAVAVEYAAVALFVSTVAGSSQSALQSTYGAILLLALVPLIPRQFVQGQVDPGVGRMVDTFACISPLPAMMHVLGQAGVGSQGFVGAGSEELWFTIFALVAIAIFIPLTVSKLNYRIFDKSRSGGKVTDDRAASVQAYRRIMYLWFFDPQRRSNLIGPFTNPVMVKEFRTQKFGRAHWMMRFFAICVLLSLALMIVTTMGTMTWGVDTLGGIVVILQMAVVVLIAPSLAAGIISSERESGGWALLQMTPMSSFTIILGKLMSAGRTLFLLLLATLPAYGVILVINRTQSAHVLSVLLTVTLTGVFALLCSAAASSLFRWTAAATATSYAILAMLCGGTMLFWLGQDAPFSRGVVEAVLRFNPVAAALALIGAPGFVAYRTLVPANWYILAVGIGLAGMVLLVRTWKLSRPQ
jgi:ABC-type transport system involved in multi-copper enzyme maturation permease subunit